MSPADSTYLQSLIDDFPCDPKLSVVDAEIRLQENYKFLGIKIIQSVVDGIKKLEQIRKNSSSIIPSITILKLLRMDDTTPEYLFRVSKIFHEYLFDKVLSNAGKFRSSSDPMNGYVGFGGSNRRAVGNCSFQGSSPAKIEEDLSTAFSYLRLDTEDPIKGGLLFYQKFVLTHPFYDGNGRIGRLILMIYLRVFDYEIDWEAYNKNEFIKRLNKCHKRANKPQEFEEYFKYFYSFMKRSIHTIRET